MDVGLEGTIRFHANSYAVDCVISNISEKVIGAMITASDPVYAEGDVDLFIYVSPDELPVKCTGRVVWYSMDKERPKDYTAGVVVDYISGIDRKRLESVMEQAAWEHALNESSPQTVQR